MRIVKIIAIAIAIYVGGGTIQITTVDDNGKSATRVVSRIESGGHLYVAANHWPRAWYRDALAHPEVTVTMDGETQTYTAVPVTGAEFDRVNADHPLGPMIRFLTGYPPRRLVRLDPAPVQSAG